MCDSPDVSKEANGSRAIVPEKPAARPRGAGDRRGGKNANKARELVEIYESGHSFPCGSEGNAVPGTFIERGRLDGYAARTSRPTRMSPLARLLYRNQLSAPQADCA
jgi:hypothetical protein